MVYEHVTEVLENFGLASESEPEVVPVAVRALAEAVRALAEAGLGPSPHRNPLAQSEY